MKTKLQLVVALLGIVALAAVFAQGPLNPPGAPAPAMKTLDQVEPRTPINDTATPGDAAYHHIITRPGSYYLTGNLEVTKTNGFDIRVAGVTLDLNGFEIRRTAGAGGNGIEVDSIAHRCTAGNGSIIGFAYGLQCIQTTNFPRGGRCLHVSVSGCSNYGLAVGDSWELEGCTAHDNSGGGINAGTGCTLSNCTATANAGTVFFGFNAGPGSTLVNCAASNNAVGIFASTGSTLMNCIATGGTSAGITAGNNCTLTNCSALNNAAIFGINVGAGCTLNNCASRGNRSAETTSGGIGAGDGCMLIGCAATGNSSSIAIATPGTGLGIRVGAHSSVRDCTVYANEGDGIQVNGDRCHVVGNTCTDNTLSVAGGGIHLTSTTNGCRIDGNHCVGGTRGFLIEGSDNLIIRNSAQGVTVANYDIAAGNHDAARVTSPGAAFASTSPWANFSF